ncbi:hypothetical protein D3C72_2494240 [compost metagenome]
MRLRSAATPANRLTSTVAQATVNSASGGWPVSAASTRQANSSAQKMPRAGPDQGSA